MQEWPGANMAQRRRALAANSPLGDWTCPLPMKKARILKVMIARAKTCSLPSHRQMSAARS